MKTPIQLSMFVAMVLALSSPAFAAFSENFQDDTVGSAPTPVSSPFGNPGWYSIGDIKVQAEGANKFLRYQDLSNPTDSAAFLFGQSEAAGYITFDIRFNQGVDQGMYVDLRPYPYSSIRLDWFHSANNTNTPLIFRSVGNSQYTTMTNDFPIGSWQTVRVDFTSTGGGLPRGTYSVSWNGITNDYQYLDQGQNGLSIDTFVLGSVGSATTQIVDIDNLMMIPEPSTLAFLAVGVSLLWRRRT